MSTARLIARLMAFLAITILGCQSIVGIEQREYDPPPPPQRSERAVQAVLRRPAPHLHRNRRPVQHEGSLPRHLRATSSG